MLFVVSARTTFKSFKWSTCDNNWKHSVKTCYQKICLVCSSRSTTTYYNLYGLWFLHTKILKFYATTVSLIKFIFNINKGTLMQAWKICKISKNTFSTEHLRTTASELKILQLRFCMIAPFTFWDVRTVVIQNVCLQACKSNRIR